MVNVIPMATAKKISIEYIQKKIRNVEIKMVHHKKINKNQNKIVMKNMRDRKDTGHIENK